MDNAPAHSALKARDLYDRMRGMGYRFEFQPPSSPDLSPLDFYAWNQLKTQMPEVDNVEALKIRVAETWTKMQRERGHEISQLGQNFVARCEACIAAGGAQFEV